ncbi:putative quinol monooxygenase [Variovorax sp. J22P168]|uniref:putative quinol monooxygenase n=1 Tax=Variovorax jilinensis TaxID=3053513 RepID=UPI002576DEB8|nr:putative quinol monooxygenase [Variovorax sp. J22P168]MDM0015307.1 putative quinol monooxygenase [Variovorax sp. J22P168]
MPRGTVRRTALAALAAATWIASTTPAVAQSAGGLRYDGVPAGAIAIVAEVRAKPGKEDEMRKATLPLVAQVRQERNNLLYFLHEDRQAPGQFVFYEIFSSQADFEAHNATPHVQAWFARLPELADGGVKVVRMEILGNRPAP